MFPVIVKLPELGLYTSPGSVEELLLPPAIKTFPSDSKVDV
jgi:hypothetical protein